MICLRRRNGKSDKHLGIKPVSSTRPRKRTTNGLIPAWVRRQPFQRFSYTPIKFYNPSDEMSIVKFYSPPKVHVDVLAKPLDNTDLVITRDRAVSSSHEPEKTPILSSKIERSRHHTSPNRSSKHDPRKQVFHEARPQPVVEARSRENKCCRSATPTGFVEARSRTCSEHEPNRSRHHIRNRAVSSSHEPDKTPISSSYTKSSGLVITRAREDTDLVIIYEIERSRHHTSPRRHRSRHHIRDRAVSSSHEPDKTNLVEARIREKSSQQSILLDETKESSRQVREKLSKAHSICGQDYVTCGSKVNNATQHHVSAASRQHNTYYRKKRSKTRDPLTESEEGVSQPSGSSL
ncbi:unnamed protein product [Microthlaspi erraticum]|uniref:Uncharacterized protein n=1 Tax=Microthlaspi erraticum TaxID=1685480 RepID=A0A6D2LMR2_9BRAS|nr:unnamed protein product [Microthlaspi erraticum]